MLERQLRHANQNSLIIEQQPILTAHERFRALKSRLRERQMPNAYKLKSEHDGGKKKIKSKINKGNHKSKKSCRFRKRSCRNTTQL